MKTRILLAALALGAAACSPAEPTAPELTPGEVRARHDGGYFGGGHRSDSDSTGVADGGYFGGGHLTDTIPSEVAGGYIGSGN